MFEIEAEEYQEEVIAKKDFPHSISVDWQRGAEFGYNKANEWHYVKDGDLPTEDLRQRTHGYYLTASKYEWNKWLIFEVAYFTGTVFTKGGNILNNVIAWKEIVPPKESE